MLEMQARDSGKVLVVGHRGAMGYAPENTMVSFEKGWELGSDLIELDIHQSRDGELIAMHDGDVARTTGGKGHKGHRENKSNCHAGNLKPLCGMC